MQLDAVGPGLAGAARALGEVADHLLDLVDRHRTGLEPMQILGLARRARRRTRELQARQIALPPGVAELDEQLAVVLLDLARQLAPERDLVVAVDPRVVGHDPAL